MTIVLDQNGNPVEAGNVAGELISLRSENAQLREELATLQEALDLSLYNDPTIRHLQEKLAAAKKDAERYRWLRRHLLIVDLDGKEPSDDDNARYDAAIDKAIREAAKK